MGKEQYGMFLTALIISAAITPIVIKLAHKIGAIDIPKDERRVHKVPIPLIGGLAIYIAFVSTVIFYMPLWDNIKGMLLGGTIILISGIIDDMRPLSAKTKFIFQIAAALVLVYYGVVIKYVTNPFDGPDGMLNISWLSIPATIFWIVGVTNAFNLIDGLDGLAAGVASISCITLFIISLINGRTVAVMLTAALAGSTIGFLPYNFNPAKIFMGDTGALFLGYMLAAISIQGAIKSAAAVVITVPVLALGLPIYDTLISMLRRYINKRPMTEADRGHLHHRLIDLGLSQRQAVLIMYFISAVLGLCSILAMELSSVKSYIILILVLCVVMVFAKEIGLLTSKKNERN